jgi:hypothetical protein
MVDWQEVTERMLDKSATIFGGELITYKPVSGGFHDVRGIWSSSYQAVDLETEASVASNSPTLGVQLSELAGLGIIPQTDDLVDARGAEYRVDDIQKDGEGGATLFLKRTA